MDRENKTLEINFEVDGGVGIKKLQYDHEEEDLWEKWTRRLPIFQNAFN